MNFELTLLKGFSQVLFQSNVFYGALILVGLAFASPLALLLAVLGNATFVFTAHALGADNALVETGLYGFNGVLIGAAVSVFVKNTPTAFIVVLVGSLLGAVVFHYLLRHNIPPLAVPLILVIWSLLVIMHYAK